MKLRQYENHTWNALGKYLLRIQLILLLLLLLLLICECVCKCSEIVVINIYENTKKKLKNIHYTDSTDALQSGEQNENWSTGLLCNV